MALTPLTWEKDLGGRRDAQSPLSAVEKPDLCLLFTIDTECPVVRQHSPNLDRAVDELIFGDFGPGKRGGGIGLQMDLLEHFGFRGSFFVDVLMEFELGQSALERTIEAIAERGHEIELHIHAEHLQWASDQQVVDLARRLAREGGTENPELFRRVMELSVDLFERRVGRKPVAYRAGAYRIGDAHFPILHEFDIRIDSSVQPYFNSRVSDWMRTRTQPFHVGEVLEIPPTFVLLNERPNDWETRGFTPAHNLGDPISALLTESSGGPPRVATFVSHSFQLLHRRDTHGDDAVEAFAERLRSGLPADMADHYLRPRPKTVRTFGEEVDDGLVAAVAGILGGVADRSNARCVTYADIDRMRCRFWPSERHLSVDPVPLIDRNRGVTGMSGTRVFGSDLLSHLARYNSAPGVTNTAELSERLPGCETGDAAELYEWLNSRMAEMAVGESLRIRFRTLGMAPPGSRRGLPPLVEVLFPEAAVEAVADEIGADTRPGLPWDAATFRAWLEEAGFEVASAQAVPRRAKELEALGPFSGKLAWLDRFELSIEALEVELRRRSTGTVPSTLSTAPFQRISDGSPPTVILSTRVDPASLPTAAAALYESMYPGQNLRLTVVKDPSPASRTTCFLALMRAGIEIIGRDDADYTLLRPLDLSDIRRFAGLG